MQLPTLQNDANDFSVHSFHTIHSDLQRLHNDLKSKVREALDYRVFQKALCCLLTCAVCTCVLAQRVNKWLKLNNQRVHIHPELFLKTGRTYTFTFYRSKLLALKFTKQAACRHESFYTPKKCYDIQNYDASS